jgi:phosphatidylglycerol:prolipoprotein diacylglycerol transferase
VIACFILFLILWRIRPLIKVPGMMFGIYLMLNGLERFFIELIRVNTKYNVSGIQFTQAELISSILFLTGLAFVVYTNKNKEKLAAY